MKRSLSVTICAALALAACAYRHEPIGPPDDGLALVDEDGEDTSKDSGKECKGTGRRCVVTVTATWSGSACTATILLSPTGEIKNTRAVGKGGGRREQAIVWKLPSRYDFVPPGIALKDAQTGRPATLEDFEPPSIKQNGKVLELPTVNRRRGFFDYTLMVRRSGGPDCAVQDPKIINDGP